ncbi:MAG: serine protease [Pyrinomonadaceae bacterium]
MLKKVIIAILFLASANINSFAGQAAGELSVGEKVAYLAKPAVVRVLDGYVGTATWSSSKFTSTFQLIYVASGSGVIVDQSGYIATNAHVVSATYDGSEKGKIALFQQFTAKVAQGYGMQVSRLDAGDMSAIATQFLRTLKMQHINNVVLQSGEQRPFEIAEYSSSREGKDVAIIKIEGSNLPILKLADSSTVHLQEHITVIGYPAAGDSQALDKQAVYQPSITDGKVSALKKRDNGAPVIQVDASATHGNSGGPVVNDNGDVVGLLTFGGEQVNGQEIQGFSFVVASNSIRELMVKSGVRNAGGKDDKTYREGVELYSQGKYTSALSKFETLKSSKLYPDIETLIQESESKKHLETSYLPVFIAITAVVLFLGIVAFLTFSTIVAVWLRRRSKRRGRSVRRPNRSSRWPDVGGQLNSA